MIVTDDRITPRWIRELDRFRHIKNLIFLHGNVLDLVTYPVDRDGEVAWTEGDRIEGFLQRFLTERGYPVVGLLDPLSGLTLVGSDNDRGESASSNDATREQDGWSRDTADRNDRRGAGRSATQDGDRRFASAVEDLATAMANRERPCAYVVHPASRMLSRPGTPSPTEHRILARLLQASLQGVEGYGPNGKLNNLIVLVCDKLNDFPPFLYVANPRARAILVDKPDRAIRERFFRSNYALFHRAIGVSTPPADLDDLAASFGFLTDGLANYELNSLLTLSRREQIPVPPIGELVSRYKFGICTSEWDSPELRDRLHQAEDLIRRRVKGQNAAVARVTDLVKRAWLGLAAGDAGRSHRPRGVLFFAGPTGVGKTEMAKALAEVLFGSDERLLRFDMSEYAAEHADQRLLGAPPGYVGYEEGGQLTNQVKENPFSVLLFDEIEKAHPRIFDKFLQILDDGRLTDGQGDTVYFSESVIIFTSNLGTVALNDETPDALGRRQPSLAASDGVLVQRSPVRRGSPYAEVRETILDYIRHYFTERLERPEILNRFGDNFVVFDFINPPLHIDIVRHMTQNLASAMHKVRGIDLALSDSARETLEGLAAGQLDHGGRGIRNIIDRALVDPLARWLFDHGSPASNARSSHVEIVAVKDNGDDKEHRFSIEVRATPNADESAS